MFCRIFVVALFLITSDFSASAGWDDGPYNCPFGSRNCVCGYNPTVGCQGEVDNGGQVCWQTSDCECQGDSSPEQQYCGTWSEDLPSLKSRGSSRTSTKRQRQGGPRLFIPPQQFEE